MTKKIKEDKSVLLSENEEAVSVGIPTVVIFDNNNKKADFPFWILFEKCLDKVNGKINQDEFIKFLDEKIDVSDYIPLHTKKSIIDIFYVVNESSENDFSDLTYLFEMFSVFTMLFLYTNIEIEDEEMTEINYDFVIKSGLVKYLKSKCKDDYKLLYNMFINSISFRNSMFVKTFADTLNIDELKNTFKETEIGFKDMDESKLSLIKSILEFNDPSLLKVKNMLYNEVVVASKNINK